jgi:hypothetical protein
MSVWEMRIYAWLFLYCFFVSLEGRETKVPLVVYAVLSVIVVGVVAMFFTKVAGRL